jgi:signal peptidase I
VRHLIALLLLASTAACASVPTDENASVYTVTVASDAMAPTLDAGQRIDAVRVEDYSPRRGDIVIFRFPAGWVSPGHSDVTGIKRVIAIGGDTVSCCRPGNAVHVNGRALDESAYLAPGPAAFMPFEVKVPDGDIWLMGDNRVNSADSTTLEQAEPG